MTVCTVEKLHLPIAIAAEIERRIDLIRNGAPGELSLDRKALMVSGGIGYACFIAPDGDAFLYEYDLEDPTIEYQRDRRAQVLTLVLGSKHISELSTLLPSRPTSAPDCEACSGLGRVTPIQILCDACHGLGWLELNSQLHD
jgi:hypothetical protein